MIDESLVVAAYRVLLGREPESSDVIKAHAQFRNVRRLLETLVNSVEFRARFPGFTLMPAWVWAETQFGCRLRVNLGDRSISAPIIEGSFEPDVTRAVQNLLRPGHVALDIGANLGYFTVLMGGIVGSGGHVHAFEGRSDLAESIALSVAENGFDDRVTVHSVALSDRAGPVYMIYAPESRNWGGAYLSYDAQAPHDHVAMPVQSARLVDLVPSDRVDPSRSTSKVQNRRCCRRSRIGCACSGRSSYPKSMRRCSGEFLESNRKITCARSAVSVTAAG